MKSLEKHLSGDFDQMTLEEHLDLAIHIGHTMISLIGTANNLGHRTLNGHLRYHMHDRTEPDSPRGQLVKWLRWITSYGAKAREEVGLPTWLVDYGSWVAVNNMKEALSEVKSTR